MLGTSCVPVASPLAYCILSNHGHFVVWPELDGEVTDFFLWLAHTHAMRWRVARRTVGYGHLYQKVKNSLRPRFSTAPSCVPVSPPNPRRNKWSRHFR